MRESTVTLKLLPHISSNCPQSKITCQRMRKRNVSILSKSCWFWGGLLRDPPLSCPRECSPYTLLAHSRARPPDCRLNRNVRRSLGFGKCATKKPILLGTAGLVRGHGEHHDQTTSILTTAPEATTAGDQHDTDGSLPLHICPNFPQRLLCTTPLLLFLSTQLHKNVQPLPHPTAHPSTHTTDHPT